MRAVITHANADLDAIASLVCARQLYGSGVALQNRSLSRAVRRYLALHKDQLGLVSLADIDAAEVDELVVVDVRDRRRLGEYHGLLDQARRVVVYDHHPSSAADIAADEVHLGAVGACTTLVCERLFAGAIELDPARATLALLGIYADTGSLSFDNTTVRDVQVSAGLLRAGARLSVVNRYMHQRLSNAQRQLLVAMIPQTETSPDYLWTVYCGLSAPKLLHFTPRRCVASPPGLNFGVLTLISPRDDAP